MATTEIEAIENAFRAAQARLGIAAGLVARDEWMGLNLSSPASGSRSLLMRLLRLILGLRSASRRLSKSYYRLARAIETKHTLDEDGEDTTLKELRDEFDFDLEAVRTLKLDWPDASAEERYASDEMLHVSKGDTESWNPAELDQSIKEWIDSIVDSDGDVNGEKVKWSEDRVRSLEDAMREFRRYIEGAGVKNLEAKIKEIKRKYADDPDRMLAELDNAFLTVRETLAGNVDKAVIDSGREWLDDVIVKDGRARLVARGVRSNPCHFCSMLASRGFVYSTERAAMAGWHINCHCYPIVRWDSKSPLPERNQYYYDMWPDVTHGYDGKEKMKAWRRWIAKQRKANGGKL